MERLCSAKGRKHLIPLSACDHNENKPGRAFRFFDGDGRPYDDDKAQKSHGCASYARERIVPSKGTPCIEGASAKEYAARGHRNSFFQHQNRSEDSSFRFE